MLSLFLIFLILPSFQGFFFRETDFHFCQFLSNFFRYLFLNFPLFYPYNIFAMYFPSNFPLLKSLSSAVSNFSYHLTSTSNLPSNPATTSFVFAKFSFLFQLSYSTINPFYHTKYFTTSLTFLLFSIFSTFHSLILSTSTSFTSSTFYLLICSLYCTIQLIFTTGWILINVSSCNLTILVDITSSIMYGPIY